MAGDGQVTLGEGVIKHSAKKIRRLYQDKILAGFAGSTADAFSLFSRFEAKLEQYHGNIGRGAVELAKDWRTDKFLRHLEALETDGSLSYAELQLEVAALMLRQPPRRWPNIPSFLHVKLPKKQ